jgi:hypothetical protein
VEAHAFGGPGSIAHLAHAYRRPCLPAACTIDLLLPRHAVATWRGVAWAYSPTSPIVYAPLYSSAESLERVVVVAGGHWAQHTSTFRSGGEGSTSLVYAAYACMGTGGTVRCTLLLNYSLRLRMTCVFLGQTFGYTKPIGFLKFCSEQPDIYFLLFNEICVLTRTRPRKKQCEQIYYMEKSRLIKPVRVT